MTKSPSPAPLWTGAALAAVCDGTIDGDLRTPMTGISIDTRSIAAGDLFVALKDQRDGHDFVTPAFKAGAVAALVSTAYIRRDGDGPLIRVTDPLRALEDAGRIARFRTNAKVVAVTGSVGKTGTKEMLRQCLSRAGAAHASEKSYNNHWGVPLTLARMPEATEYGVFEIGMNHPGEIAPLVRMVAPDVGIITTVEAVHLAQFASVSEIAEEKAELMQGLSARQPIILNCDNRFFDLLCTRAAERDLEVVSFGAHDAADVRLEAIDAHADFSEITATAHGRPLAFRLGAPGRHYAMNALAAIAAIDALGADLATCLPALAEIAAPAGRGARQAVAYKGGTILLIDESYNANPASMAAALANLGAVPRNTFARRIAIIGDMRELGAEAERLHRGLAGAVEAAGADLVFACGEHMRALYDTLPAALRGAYATTSLQLIPAIKDGLAPGDAVMIKGSLGTNMAPLVKTVREIAGNTA